jgi:hypothetical protein
MNYRKARAKAVAMESHVVKQSANPLAGSSLVPMLVVGLALTFAGMIAALALS